MDPLASNLRRWMGSATHGIRFWAERAALLAEEKEFVTREFVRALNGRGNQLLNQRDYPQALVAYNLVQTIAAQIGDRLFVAVALSDKASIARTLGSMGKLHQKQGNSE